MQQKEIKVWSLDGNHQWLDGGAMFGNVPRALWQRWYEPDEASRIRLNCRAMLIELNGKKILCETGIGAFMEPKMRERYGVESDKHELLVSLGNVGLTHKDIDWVVLSHLHFDHAGGLLPAHGEWQEPLDASQLLFPNAQYLVGVDAFARAEQPHFRDRASFIHGLAEALQQSGRLVLIKRGQEANPIDPAIGFRFSDGHTPGQMHTVVTGNDHTIMYAADLIPGTAWVHLPVTMGYDRYPEMLIDEKQELYKTCIAESWLLFFTHDPYIAASRVQYDADAHRFQVQSPYERLEAFSL